MKRLSVIIILFILIGCGHTQVKEESKEAVRRSQKHETATQHTKKTNYSPQGDIISIEETETVYESNSGEVEEVAQETTIETVENSLSWTDQLKRFCIIISIVSLIAGIAVVAFRVWRAYQLFKP